MKKYDLYTKHVSENNIYAAKCMWFSMILNNSGGWGILPVSSLDHTGISENENKLLLSSLKIYTTKNMLRFCIGWKISKWIL